MIKPVLLVCICCFNTDVVHTKVCEISVASKICRYSFMLQSHIVSESSDTKLWYLWGGIKTGACVPRSTVQDHMKHVT